LEFGHFQTDSPATPPKLLSSLGVELLSAFPAGRGSGRRARSYDPGVGLEVVFGVGDGAALSLTVCVGEEVGVDPGRRAGAGLGVVLGLGVGIDGVELSLAVGVGEAVGVDSGRREEAGLGDGVDGIALSLAGVVVEDTGVASGRRVGAGLDAGSGSDGRTAGEVDGVALARISLRRFKICSRL
jgi:hypothetical protein